jgi:RNA polymerase sigma factor (sigma-70 family)
VAQNSHSVTRQLNEAYVDPLQRGGEEFWQLASTYACYVARKLTSSTEADDVAQDAIVTAFEKLSAVQDHPAYDKFDEADGTNSFFSRWLHGVVRNAARNLRHKRKEIAASQLGRHIDGEFVSMKLEPAVPFLDPFELVESDEAKDARELATAAKLDEFRESLTKRQMEVFDLLRQGLSVTEVAQHLGVGYSRVAEHINRWHNRAQEGLNSDPIAAIR